MTQQLEQMKSSESGGLIASLETKLTHQEKLIEEYGQNMQTQTEKLNSILPVPGADCMLTKLETKIANQEKQIKEQVMSMKQQIETAQTGSEMNGLSSSLRTIQESIASLEKNLSELRTEVPSRAELATSLSSLGTHSACKKGWGEARDKAEEMAQIFDSLIITNDRPYVSCGLVSPASCSGLIEFTSFDLINKINWDPEMAMFTLVEPGVYVLQVGGSLSKGSLVAKLVNDEVEAEIVSLDSVNGPAYKCRSTIFTVEDDDQLAERLMLELLDVEEGEEEPQVDKDLSFLLYKISEVATGELV